MARGHGNLGHGVLFQAMAKDHGNSEVVYKDHVIPQAIVSLVDSSHSEQPHTFVPPSHACVLILKNFGVRYRRGPISKRGSGTENSGQTVNVYLARYFTPGHVAIDMGVFPSAEVREYAYDGLYSMVYHGRGQPSHVTCTPFTCFCEDEVAKTNSLFLGRSYA